MVYSKVYQPALQVAIKSASNILCVWPHSTWLFLQVVVDILSFPFIDDKKKEFEVELKMEFKWKDPRLNVAGLEKKTNYDPRR